MKKLFALLLCASILASFVGCMIRDSDAAAEITDTATQKEKTDSSTSLSLTFEEIAEGLKNNKTVLARDVASPEELHYVYSDGRSVCERLPESVDGYAAYIKKKEISEIKSITPRSSLSRDVQLCVEITTHGGEYSFISLIDRPGTTSAQINECINKGVEYDPVDADSFFASDNSVIVAAVRKPGKNDSAVYTAADISSAVRGEYTVDEAIGSVSNGISVCLADVALPEHAYDGIFVAAMLADKSTGDTWKDERGNTASLSGGTFESYKKALEEKTAMSEAALAVDVIIDYSSNGRKYTLHIYAYLPADAADDAAKLNDRLLNDEFIPYDAMESFLDKYKDSSVVYKIEDSENGEAYAVNDTVYTALAKDRIF